jgi:putative aminopeptidase FrvX
LNQLIRKSANNRNIHLQSVVLNGFGTDGSYSVKQGHVPRAACLGFPTHNTHGFEIANLITIGKCADVLEEFSREDRDWGSRE